MNFKQITLAMSRNRADVHQLEELLCYMERHPKFAKGHITDLGCLGHDKYKNMWKDLSIKLNNIGPVNKSVAAWTKTWKLMKSAAKKRKAQYTVAMNKTGNESPVPPLNDFDERITSIFGKHGTGLSVIEEIGVPCTPMDKIIFDETSDEEIGIPLHISELDLAYNLNALQQQNQRTREMWYKTFEDFEDVMFKLMDKLDCLENLRDKKKTKHRSNQAQMKCMVEFMEKNVLFANGQLDDTDSCADSWVRLTRTLNALGETKDVKGWTKTWNDLVKSVHQRRTLLNTGQRNTPVPDLDFRVLAIGEKGAQELVPKDNSSLHISQKYGSCGISLSPTVATRSNRSPVLRERSPLPSLRISPHRSTYGSPRRSAYGSPRRSPYGSPRHSPYNSHRHVHDSPRRCSQRTPTVSPRRSAHAAPQRSPTYSSHLPMGPALEHSPRHSARNSPIRSPRYTGVNLRSCSDRSSMSYRRQHLSHRDSTEPGPSNRSSSQIKPKPVPLVDLTTKAAASGPTSREKSASTVKGGNANTSAVIAVMENYAKTMTDFVDEVIKCFTEQNQILQTGFATLGRKLGDAADKILNNLVNEREYNCHQRNNVNKNEDSHDVKADNSNDESDDKWPTEYLESHLFPDDSANDE